MSIERYVTSGRQVEPTTFEWGTITWLDNYEMMGRDALTVGLVTFNPGARNSEHRHPNCDEAIYLLSGRLRHTLGSQETVLEPGDLLHIPQGEPHQGHNVGDGEAAALVMYDTGRREFEHVVND